MPETPAAGEDGYGWVLLATVAGLIVVYLFGTFAQGTPPAASDTGEQVVAWFRAHRDGVRWSVWAGTVAAPLFSLITALLRRRLPAPHRDVFLIGGTAIVVAGAVQTWTWEASPCMPIASSRRAHVTCSTWHFSSVRC